MQIESSNPFSSTKKLNLYSLPASNSPALNSSEASLESTYIESHTAATFSFQAAKAFAFAYELAFIILDWADNLQ